MCMCMFVCTYTCMHACKHTHTHTHTHTHNTHTHTHRRTRGWGRASRTARRQSSSATTALATATSSPCPSGCVRAWRARPASCARPRRSSSHSSGARLRGVQGPLHRYDGHTHAKKKYSIGPSMNEGSSAPLRWPYSRRKKKIRKKQSLSHIFDFRRRYAMGQSGGMSSYGQVGSLLYRNSSARPYNMNSSARFGLCPFPASLLLG